MVPSKLQTWLILISRSIIAGRQARHRFLSQAVLPVGLRRDPLDTSNQALRGELRFPAYAIAQEMTSLQV